MPPKKSWSEADKRFMALAFAEAVRVKGKTLPNPPVGAVFVKGGRVVGAGGTGPAGQAHAEIKAMAKAGKRARGSTLYVTLEPCSHHGRTPPCTDALIAAGVRRVFAAARDPNPLVRGKGLRALRRAGVVVNLGLLGAEAADFYAGFFFYITRGRPAILLKVAQSLDGRINARPGERTKITGSAAKKWTHSLRAKVDAVLIGGRTLRCDDPDLTPRLAKGGHPETVILSRHGPFPLSSKLFTRGRKAKTLVLSESRGKLPGWVCHEPLIPGAGNSAVIAQLLALFTKRGYHSVLVEGGRDLWALFLNAGICDSLYIFTAAKMYPQGERWDSALDPGWGKSLKFRKFTPFGDDTLLEFGKADSDDSSFDKR
jgi:diaminohydroxyphosphoribosylaminopyrimidine deaminase / 5-amino-6-(5-phosphoribosylamino)uracil reductase